MKRCFVLALIALTSLTVSAVLARESAEVPNVFNRYVLNQGQWPTNVIAAKHTSDLTIWVTTTGWTYDQRTPSPDALMIRGNATAVSVHVNDVQASLLSTQVMGVDTIPCVGERPLVLADTLVRTFSSGYTIVDYVDQHEARYDVHCSSGSAAEFLSLHLDGHTSLSVEGNDVVISSPLGELRQGDLHVFAKMNQDETPIASKFLVSSESIRFSTANAPQDLPLVIDPIVRSTYAGNCCLAVKDVLEINGEIYTVGTYTSQSGSTFPQTPGAYTSPNRGNVEGFVLVFTKDLSRLLRGTLIGGSAADNVQRVMSVGDSAIVIIGSTASSDYPVTQDAQQSALAGGSDAVLSVLSKDLRQLRYSTFHGTDGNENFLSITRDSDSTLILTGDSRNLSFPVVSGANVGTGGGADMGIARYSTRTWRLLTSFNVGGNGNDQLQQCIALNDNTVAFVGQSVSGFPLPMVGHTTTKPTTSTIDALIFRMDASLSTMLSCTWVGGEGVDGFWSGIQKRDGDLVVMGSSSNSPKISAITSNALQSEPQGGGDMIVAVYSSDLAALRYCSYLGGSSPDYPHTLGGNCVAELPTGEIAILGLTQSANFPVSSPTYDSTFSVHDLALSIFRPTLDSMVFATYIGGSDQEGALTSPISGGMSLMSDSTIVIGTMSRSVDFPTSSNAYFSSRPDFLTSVVFTFAPNALRVTRVSPSSLCGGDTLDVSWRYSGPQQSIVNVHLVNSQSQVFVTSVPAAVGRLRVPVPALPPGTYVVRITVAGTGGSSDSAAITVSSPSRLVAPEPATFAVAGERTNVTVTFTAQTSSNPVQVNSVFVKYGDAQVVSTTPALPVALSSGQTLEIELSVSSVSGPVGVYAGVGACSASDTAVVTPETSTVTVRVRDAEFSVNPSQIGIVEIVADPSFSSMLQQGVDSVRVQLQYSTHFLIPENIAARGTDAGTDQTIVVNTRLSDVVDDRITIPMIPLLGPDSVTTVRLSRVEFSRAVRVNTVDGRITLRGHCLAGGLRSVVASSAAATPQIVPNPASSSVSVHEGSAMLSGPYVVTSPVGQVYQRGDTSGSIDVTALPSGIYSLRIAGRVCLLVVQR